jgi:hypothetical protein
MVSFADAGKARSNQPRPILEPVVDPSTQERIPANQDQAVTDLERLVNDLHLVMGQLKKPGNEMNARISKR